MLISHGFKLQKPRSEVQYKIFPPVQVSAAKFSVTPFPELAISSNFKIVKYVQNIFKLCVCIRQIW